MITPTTTRDQFNTTRDDVVEKFENGLTNEQLIEQQRQAGFPFPMTVEVIVADRLPGTQVPKSE